MKKLIILAIATLSTGIVLSANFKKEAVAIKPTTIELHKSTSHNLQSIDAVAQGD